MSRPDYSGTVVGCCDRIRIRPPLSPLPGSATDSTDRPCTCGYVPLRSNISRIFLDGSARTTLFAVGPAASMTTEDTGRPDATRRQVLRSASAGLALGALATLFSTGAAATDADPSPASGGEDLFDVERTSEAVYPQSVASGGPTPSGAITWTRVAEAAYEPDRDVGLQVAPAPDRSTPTAADSGAIASPRARSNCRSSATTRSDGDGHRSSGMAACSRTSALRCRSRPGRKRHRRALVRLQAAIPDER